MGETRFGCIVTGIDESHALESHGMILNALQVIPEWKIFVYDLGLYLESVKHLEKVAHVLPAPTSIPEWALSFERYTTSFKPWILEDLSTRLNCSLVMYADASIRFKPSFANFTECKHCLPPLNLLQTNSNQKDWTHPQMYKWFSRSPSNCTLRQYQGGTILFRPESHLWRQVSSLLKKMCTIQKMHASCWRSHQRETTAPSESSR